MRRKTSNAIRLIRPQNLKRPGHRKIWSSVATSGLLRAFPKIAFCKQCNGRCGCYIRRRSFSQYSVVPFISRILSIPACKERFVSVEEWSSEQAPPRSYGGHFQRWPPLSIIFPAWNQIEILWVSKAVPVQRVCYHTLTRIALQHPFPVLRGADISGVRYRHFCQSYAT